MKKKLLFVFAVIGLFSTITIIYDLVKKQYDATQYLQNCEKVKVGMTLNEARMIMGDAQFPKRKNSSVIWTNMNDRDTLKRYALSYPSPFAASSGTEIFFDPATHLVTFVGCGEK